ncbi:MAG: hypothetical protein ACPIA2_19110, partial [Mariniblastus sp.]
RVPKTRPLKGSSVNYGFEKASGFILDAFEPFSCSVNGSLAALDGVQSCCGAFDSVDLQG